MKDLWQRGSALWAEFSRMNATTYASSICYFSFLSIVPLLALCISLVSIVGIEQQEVVLFFCSLLPDALHDFVKALVEDAFVRSDVAFSVSSITLLWSASKGMKALRRGLNAAYAVEETRNFVHIAVVSIVAVLILGLLLTAVMCLIFSGVVVNVINTLFPDAHVQKGILTTVDLIATMVLGTFGLAACYAFLPAERQRYAAQLPGALCSALACSVFTFGFYIYIDNFSNFTVLYGSIATVAVFLFWMYLVFNILLAGGFINHFLKDMRKGVAKSALSDVVESQDAHQ